ncbi:MAG: hypothetical protein FJZ59_01725 [Chlamydiae bacterium]|nr:hypothetical protein [Chlamydiota bacterium]
MITPLQAATMRCRASQDPTHMNAMAPLSKDSLKFLEKSKESCIEKILRIARSFYYFCSRRVREVPSLIRRTLSWIVSKCNRSPAKNRSLVGDAKPQREIKERSIPTLNAQTSSNRVRGKEIASKIVELQGQGYFLESFRWWTKRAEMTFKNLKTDSQILVVI